MSARRGVSFVPGGWPSPAPTRPTQAALAEASGQTQPAVARFEAGGTVPTIPVLERLANALGAELVVRLTPRTTAA